MLGAPNVKVVGKEPAEEPKENVGAVADEEAGAGKPDDCAHRRERRRVSVEAFRTRPPLSGTGGCVADCARSGSEGEAGRSDRARRRNLGFSTQRGGGAEGRGRRGEEGILSRAAVQLLDGCADRCGLRVLRSRLWSCTRGADGGVRLVAHLALGALPRASAHRRSQLGEALGTGGGGSGSGGSCSCWRRGGGGGGGRSGRSGGAGHGSRGARRGGGGRRCSGGRSVSGGWRCCGWRETKVKGRERLRSTGKSAQ